MQKSHFVISTLAGFGVGMAAAVMLGPMINGKSRRRLRDGAERATGLFKKRARTFGSAAGEALQNGHQEISRAVSDFKDKIDDAAAATKKAADQVIDKSRDVAHHMGKKMEDAGKRLQDT